MGVRIKSEENLLHFSQDCYIFKQKVFEKMIELMYVFVKEWSA